MQRYHIGYKEKEATKCARIAHGSWGRYVTRESMRKTIIYGAGLIIVFSLVGFLLFLTLQNVFSGQAILGDENALLTINGYPAVLINLSIFGAVISLMIYLVYLFNRRNIFHKVYSCLGMLSGVLLFLGVVLNAT